MSNNIQYHNVYLSLQNHRMNQETLAGFTTYTVKETSEAFRYHNILGHQNCDPSNQIPKIQTFHASIMYKMVKHIH